MVLGFAEPFLLALDSLNLNPADPYDDAADKFVVSMGHASLLAYSALVNLGLVPPEKRDLVVAKFRALDDVVDGHVSHHFPHVRDSTGHLGYGIAIAAGHAIADRLRGHTDTHILVPMGDGEQTKGPAQESARFVQKHGLTNITVLIDYNGQQLSNACEKVMPMNIRENYEANGWDVFDVNGYSLTEVQETLAAARKSRNNVVILAHTVMGKGVREAEGTHKYHGCPVKNFDAAIADLEVENRLARLKELRDRPETTGFHGRVTPHVNVNAGERIVYQEKKSGRAAFGEALAGIAKLTLQANGTPNSGYSPMAVFDCDVLTSTKTDGFAGKYPANFFQAGIQEHSTATIAGTVSTRGVSTWLAMFGVFGHTMTLNEHLLTAQNEGNLKLVTTHNSIDVGEDGKTHSPTNYSALSTIPGWRTVCPGDANQADAVVRWMANEHGNIHMPVGRSDNPIIMKQGTDEPFFDAKYKFDPTRFDLLRDYHKDDGSYDVVIITYGTPAFRAIKAWDVLHDQGKYVAVINVSTPKDLPEGIAEIATKSKLIITFEDHHVGSGIAPEIETALGNFHRRTRTAPSYDVVNIGMPKDRFSKSAQSEQLYKHFGIHEENLVRIARSYGFLDRMGR